MNPDSAKTLGPQAARLGVVLHERGRTLWAVRLGSALQRGAHLLGCWRFMVQSGRLHRYTYADYVALEESSSTKHEYLQGEIYAMAGGSEEHSALAAEVLRALGNALADGPCRAHTSDLRIYVEATGMATFPDASVVCGKLEQHGASPRATALNPMVLVEVTSDSSEEYDTTTKLQSYQTIPSLRDYLIVSHRERRITLHFRAGDGGWETRVAIAGGKLALSSLPSELRVDDLYRASLIA